MKIVIYGLTITSSWGNGHATTYRSLCKALARRKHRIEFVEKDVRWYRENRDLPKPGYCSVHLYREWLASESTLTALAKDADVVVIGSYFPDAIAATHALLAATDCPVLFYDIDTPITVAGLRESGRCEYLESSLIPYYSAYLSFTGGPMLGELEDTFGANRAVPFFCSVDDAIYKPVARRADYACDLSYLGTYAADRQAKLAQLLQAPAGLLPSHRFIVAGPQYPADIGWEENVAHIQHVPPCNHPAFYSSSRFTLNLTREEMVRAGYSPSVRLFEASACAAPIVSDSWPGIETFLTPGEEILLPANAEEVSSILQEMPEAEYRRIGRLARERVLSQHTAMHRARQFEQIVSDCAGNPGESVGRDPVRQDSARRDSGTAQVSA